MKIIGLFSENTSYKADLGNIIYKLVQELRGFIVQGSCPD